MKDQILKVWKNAVVVAFAISVVFGTGLVFAAPTTAPSTGVGVSLPLTVGPEAQTKTGNLTVSGTLAATNLTATNLTATTLNVDEACMGGDCVSVWPSAGLLTTAQTAVASLGASYRGQCQATYYDNILGYRCPSPVSVSVYVPVSVPSGGVLTSASSGSATCHSGYSGYSYCYDANGQNYGWRWCYTVQRSYPPISQPVASLSGNYAVVTASCYVTGSYYQTISYGVSGSAAGTYLTIQ